MGTQPENQQYKKSQVPPSIEDRDNDFKKQGADRGKKAAGSIEDEDDVDTDSDTDLDDDASVSE